MGKEGIGGRRVRYRACIPNSDSLDSLGSNSRARSEKPTYTVPVAKRKEGCSTVSKSLHERCLPNGFIGTRGIRISPAAPIFRLPPTCPLHSSSWKGKSWADGALVGEGPAPGGAPRCCSPEEKQFALLVVAKRKKAVHEVERASVE